MNKEYKKKRVYIRKTINNDIVLLKKKKGNDYRVIAILFEAPNSISTPYVGQILRYRKSDLKTFKTKENAIMYVALDVL